MIAAVAFSLEAGLVTARWRQERQERLEEERVRLPLSYRVCWVLSNINSSMSGAETVTRHSILLSLLVLICLVYWCALYSPHKHQLDFENFSGHLLTSVACVLDVWISDRPWRLSHALHPILFGAVFGVFSLIFHFLRGSNYFFEPYIYHILDWNRPSRWDLKAAFLLIFFCRTSLVIGGVFLSLVVLHLLFYLMFRIRSGISRGRKKSLSEPGALIDQEV